MFNSGDKVQFRATPSLKGIVAGIIPARGDLPESVSVDMWIPEDEPGFVYTGVIENFWCDQSSLEAV